MMIKRSEKLQIRDQDYIQDLEEERRKIQVFQRELPLCLELITQAIETCKQQLSGKTAEFNLNGGQSECSEQTSNDAVPFFFEEFIPIKKDEEQESKKPKNDVSCNKDGKIDDIHNKNIKKSDWLKSVQLWNQTPDQPSKDDLPRKVSVVEVKSTISSSPTQVPEDKCVPPASTSSTGGGGDENKEEKKEGRSQRKSRRCWSLELHERFLQALQQLGGSHVATPKQIREMMKIDGLTNDEVKSHLQKYRLHSRRPNYSIHNNNYKNNTQTPHFVVVGGIWVPPEYAAMATTTTTSVEAQGGANTAGIYAPIATWPPPFQGKQHKISNIDDRGEHSEGVHQSHSSTTSSSMHTSNATPSF
ncbi:hypothetical protein RD792_015416 [Penstemon davidsonii]|uniref:HTH myb-type domain-containing protein n=1 Tax=Penstemon davidsonii TaxID=160366 RepID=A0ABR0CS45_9LAMI|nr:hypothetical protein RD792_015416 [Penstemon davidsonii]